MKELGKLSQYFSNLEKKNPEKERKKFLPPTSEIAIKAGYILFKDSKVVAFHSNDLVISPSNTITRSEDPEFAVSVRGLGKIEIWTGSKNLVRADLLVANLIITCDKLMSRVDRYD